MKMRSLTARRQRGAVLVFAAMAISALIIGLSLIELGLLYQYRREYQKTVDLAALAGAQHLRDGCAAATAAANQAVALNIGGRNHTAPSITCGDWRPATASFDPAAPDHRAVEVTISGAPPALLPFIGNRTLSARAIAVADQPLASLSLRTTLANINTAQSPLLNAVVGGLLGGNLNLPVAAWNGLLNANLQLLSFAEALAIRVGVSVSDTAGLLASQVRVGDLLDTALAVLPPGSTADLAINGILNASLPGLNDTIRVGDLLALDANLPSGGLDAVLNVFDLVQTTVQLAGQHRVVDVNLGIAQVKVRIVEPPQLSVVGNPEWAAAEPFGPNRIEVRSAQVRTLISVNLPALSGITGLVNTVLDLASPVTTLLNNVLSLNLVAALEGLLGSLLGNPYEVTDIQVVPGNPRIDISLDAAGAEARVVGFSCSANGSKRLDMDGRTAAARLRIGQMDVNPNSPGYVLNSAAVPNPAPVPLVDVGVKSCTCFLLLICDCQPRRPFEGGGIGIRAQTDIAASNISHDFIDPPEVGEEPDYERFAMSNVVGSLSSTLSGIQLQMYGPAQGGGLGGVLNLVGATFNTLKGILEPLITGLLSPLLDPLLNLLVSTLGLELAAADVGANLSCDGGGATLVR